jgi:hypothetical protein
MYAAGADALAFIPNILSSAKPVKLKLIDFEIVFL